MHNLFFKFTHIISSYQKAIGRYQSIMDHEKKDITLHKNRLYAKARKENHDNGDRSTTPTICPFGMNAEGGFVM